MRCSAYFSLVLLVVCVWAWVALWLRAASDALVARWRFGSIVIE